MSFGSKASSRISTSALLVPPGEGAGSGLERVGGGLSRAALSVISRE